MSKKKEGVYNRDRLIQINLHRGDDTVTGIALLKPPLLFRIDDKNTNCIIINQLRYGRPHIQIELETTDQAKDQLEYIYKIMENPYNWKGWEDGDDVAPFVMDLVYDDRECQHKREEARAKEHEVWERCECGLDEGCRKCLKRNKWYNKIINSFMLFIGSIRRHGSA